MNKLNMPSTDVGVIIGRFQVHDLHEGQRSLIDTVRDAHDTVLIFIGLSPLRGTMTNPLDFASRKRMIQEAYPDVNVYYIEDRRSDEAWSSNLDYQIGKWTKPHQTVTLYGSRDSFIPHYTGVHTTTALESEIWVSGTEVRRRISNNFRPTKDFRAGVISASFDRYPTVYTTVDVAVVNKETGNVLLVKKPTETQWRFPGGFSDPTSPTFEADARREVMEETSVEADDYTYIGSTLIDDWRYRNGVDKIKTLMFIATYVFGRPTGGDDVEMAMWVSIENLFTGDVDIVDEHLPLVEMFKQYTVKSQTD